MRLRIATTHFILSTLLLSTPAAQAARMGQQQQQQQQRQTQSQSTSLPNIVVVMIDDLGYNQVGYHARKVGNTEIQTPSIDEHATTGIRMERGYMTPWCAPSRAAFQTGTMTSFNADVTNNIYAFDDSIGFIGGLQAGTKTLASALKAYTAQENLPHYSTSYTGKWGIGGTAWTNAPMAVGYDDFLGYWGDSIDSCDGWVPTSSVPGTKGAMMRAVPGYWKQNKHANNELCDKFQSLDNSTITQLEKDIACQSVPVKKLDKIMDLDLLDHTKDIIRNHDYSQGPLYHMHATQIMHLPMQYPEYYDENMTWYGQDEMPQPTNEILRLKTANMIKFMDDIFEGIMDEIKTAQQWDNTIVLFTTDNGGAIYTNSANNNYPLRGAKLSSFEGGLRVSQFLTGGWLDQNLPANRSTESDTYVIVNDWAPTLLQMVGANKSYLLGNLNGNTEGNGLWEQIKNSVVAEDSTVSKSLPSQTHQLPRNVTFSPKLTMEIEQSTARKYIDTGNDDKIYFARKWEATWPTNDDIIPDFGYVSINPCRPGGVTMQCCYFDIEADPEEDTPLTTDCDAHAQYANETYYTQHLCLEQPQLCTSTVDIPSRTDQEVYNLWSLYGASGPFTNSSGFPITAELLGETTRCTCAVMQYGLKDSDVDAFIPTPESPTTCFDKSTLSMEERLHAIDCDGTTTFSRPPFEGDYYESYANEGFEYSLLEPWFEADRKGQIARLLHVPDIVQLLQGYAARQGFGRFPNFAKFPFIAAGQDSCAEKGVVPNPVPVLALAPWFATTGDVTVPSSSETLCNPYGAELNFCASKQNPLQHKITAFNYSASAPSFTTTQSSGETVVKSALTHAECLLECEATHLGTAYIGDGPWGMSV